MKLSTQDRKNLPASSFAGPGRTYPVPDANHARLALSGASRALHVGNISPSIKAKIDRKANAMLGHSNVKNPKSHQNKLDHS